MKVEEKDVKKILENYNLGKIKKIKHVWQAFENAVYIITTSKRKYILKIFGRSDPNFIRYEMKIMDYLSKKGLPVQKVFKNKQGKLISKDNGKNVVLFEYIDKEIKFFKV